MAGNKYIFRKINPRKYYPGIYFKGINFSSYCFITSTLNFSPFGYGMLFIRELH